jgi:hypothetical protein
MLGLFGRDQVKHTPGANAQMRFKIGDTYARRVRSAG